MGTAALDLPDPLQAPPEGPKGSTDDLLAQLAGEEIDRLLASADADPAPVSEARIVVPPPVSAGQETPQAGDGKAAAAAGTEPPVTQVPPKLSEACEEISAELDALFNQAIVQSTPAVGTPGPAGSSADRSALDAVSAAALDAETELDAATTAAERDGLKTPAGVAPLHAAGVQSLAAPRIDDVNTPLPLYLRPLEWLNAPLALFPESVRDLIGKAAIVTLLNAAAILAYVLVVRRGH